MKDLNAVKLAGTIFWSKLDDRQTYSVLRLGVKLNDGSSAFISINNPSVKGYESTKAGNKLLVSSGYLDLWVKDDGSSEVQIKASDASVHLYPKEKALADVNQISIVGKVVEYSGDTATIEMIGERNPKTNQPTVRKTKVKIGSEYKDIVNSKIMLDAKITSVDVDGKSKLVIEAIYDKIIIL